MYPNRCPNRLSALSGAFCSAWTGLSIPHSVKKLESVLSLHLRIYSYYQFNTFKFWWTFFRSVRSCAHLNKFNEKLYFYGQKQVCEKIQRCTKKLRPRDNWRAHCKLVVNANCMRYCTHASCFNIVLCHQNVCIYVCMMSWPKKGVWNKPTLYQIILTAQQLVRSL